MLPPLCTIFSSNGNMLLTIPSLSSCAENFMLINVSLEHIRIALDGEPSSAVIECHLILCCPPCDRVVFLSDVGSCN